MFSSLLGVGLGLGGVIARAASAVVQSAPRPFRRKRQRSSKSGRQRNAMGARCRLKRAAANRYVYAIRGVRP